MNNLEMIEVFIFNYNGKNTILSTIETLYQSLYVNISISVIDDHSTDESLEMVRKCFPNVNVHILPYNTKKLNLLRNKALSLAKGRYVFITDNDLKFDPGCLSELLKVMNSDNTIATCTPRLMHWEEPDRVYTAGTKVHYIGSAIGPHRNEIIKEFPYEVTSNSGGGILLIDREKAIEAGSFDENVLVMAWGDDGEFYQRLLRYGYKCLYVSSAYAFHEDKPFTDVRSFRAEGQIFNRLVLILSHYSLITIILLIPAFFVYELLQFFFMTLKKMPLLYFRANLKVIKSFGKILIKRKEIQERRKVSDKDVIYSGEIYVSPVLLKNPVLNFLLSMVNKFFHIYWQITKPLIP